MLKFAGRREFGREIASHGDGPWFDKGDWERTLAARACLIGFGILLVSSAVDYPLRVPSLAVIGTIFAAMQFRWRQSASA